MKINDLYTRLAILPDFDELPTVRPLAVAAGFRSLRERETEETLSDDEMHLLYDLAQALAVWGFDGLQPDALAWVSNNDWTPPEPANDDPDIPEVV